MSCAWRGVRRAHPPDFFNPPDSSRLPDLGQGVLAACNFGRKRPAKSSPEPSQAARRSPEHIKERPARAPRRTTAPPCQNGRTGCTYAARQRGSPRVRGAVQGCSATPRPRRVPRRNRASSSWSRHVDAFQSNARGLHVARPRPRRTAPATINNTRLPAATVSATPAARARRLKVCIATPLARADAVAKRSAFEHDSSQGEVRFACVTTAIQDLIGPDTSQLRRRRTSGALPGAGQPEPGRPSPGVAGGDPTHLR